MGDVVQFTVLQSLPFALTETEATFTQSAQLSIDLCCMFAGFQPEQEAVLLTQHRGDGLVLLFEECIRPNTRRIAQMESHSACVESEARHVEQGVFVPADETTILCGTNHGAQQRLVVVTSQVGCRRLLP
ncbi:hypothetical protein AQ946_05635 [Burkholderia pseudomallei]|nr:hypothetical protein AQ766_27330 [Burkholderia pseudomallei]ONE15041.1 hypothetical protein AQ946_05635 [Burkholderia pseudomallei]ONE40759.1 hypothetical protein AQ948_12545 [Burkholderia pseudomallei]